ESLSLLGAHCVLLARDAAALEQAIQLLDVSQGQTHDHCVADFSNPETVRTAIHTVTKKRAVHVLVNNTGGPASGPIIEATDQAFLSAFNQHLVCNHLLVQAVVPAMQAAGYGRIINVVSTSVKIPLRNLGVSNTIRGAVASWAKTLANELGPSGITVNNILPGLTATRRLRQLMEQAAQKGNLPLDLVERNMVEEVPLRRIADPAEIAAVAAFLASPAASYVNGVSLPVDGGRTGSI
ncbi:MAG: hypothetical protein RJA57_625, partial [Bacteroidota bacterium]